MRNLSELVLDRAGRRPDARFGVTGSVVSLATAVDRAVGLVGDLATVGIGPGSRVALIGRTSTAYLHTWLALTLAGAENALELHPNWLWGHVKKGLAHALAGQREEALTSTEKAEELTGGWGSAFLQGWIAWTYAVIGDREAVDRIVRRGEQGVEEKRIEDPIGVVLAYLAAGDVERSLDWAERTVEEGSPNAVFMSVLTQDHMAPLAPPGFGDNPRFRALLARLQIPLD